MLTNLLIATRNAGKLQEFKNLFTETGLKLVSLFDLGINEEIEETGTTFEENAVLKAESYCDLSGLTTLADDSGLEVDGLHGEPGVYSSRFAGPDANDSDRIAFLLRKLQDIPQISWTARFRCVIALATPNKPTEMYSGVCEGRIEKHPRGSCGFGYDPIFLVPCMNKTMGELNSQEKNAISHRSIAAAKVIESLRIDA